MSRPAAPESASDLTTAPFVVLRTPWLPADVLSWWSGWSQEESVTKLVQSLRDEAPWLLMPVSLI